MKKNEDVIAKEPGINVKNISDQILSFENKKTSILDIIGQRFETDKEGKLSMESFKAISRAMEIYSDKHYETARYLFVKDGQILRHITVTSQTPSATAIKPNETFLHNCRRYAINNDAQIVFLHNHPSGYVEPSQEDKELTEYLSNFFSETDQNGDIEKSYFAGHIILDHGSYGLYTDVTKEWQALIDDKVYPIKEAENRFQIQLTEHKILARFEGSDRSVSSQSLIQMADYARKCDSGDLWNKKDWIPSLLLTNNGVVTSLEMFNNAEFKDLQHMAGKLKSLGREYGSENIVFFPNDTRQFLLCESFAQRTGMVKEIYYETDEGFNISNFSNGNIFKLTRGDLKVEDSNDYKKEVEEILLSSESVNITRNSLKINNDKENKLMDNEEKIEPSISEDVNVAEKNVVTSEELAEKTTSFVTGNTFSKRNQENIASLLDALRIQDKILGEKAQLVSEDQIMMAEISIEDFANNMKDIPFAEITVPDEADEGEEQTFHKEKYYLLDSLPEFLKEKVLNFKSEIQFNQNLKNAKLIPLNQKNVSEFTDYFIKTLSNSSMSDEMKDNISKKIQASIGGINSDNENIKKQSFKDLRAFVSAAQVIATNFENTSFMNEIQKANSLEAVFDITSRTVHESYVQKRNFVDRSSQSLVETVGREYKMARLLAPERNRELFDSILYPEGHGYTQVEKETSINNANLSESEKSSSKTGVPYFTDEGNIFIGSEDMSKEDIEKFSKIVDEEAKSHQPKDMSKVIVFDTETTGKYAGDDELLQISIADGNGNTIFNSYVKPENKTSWETAMKINGITPEMVKDAPAVKELVPELQKIFDDADMLISYNGRFDVNFLETAGVNISEQKPHLDVIKSSAAITQYPMNGKNDKRSIDGYHYPKLTDVASHFGIEYKAHDSMGDTLATLQVAKNIYGENLEKVTPEILTKYTIDEKKPSVEKEKIIEMTEDKYHTNVGKYVFENHPEFLDEIKNNPGNETTKGLLERLEKYPDGKNFKTILNTMVGEAVAESHPEILEAYEKTLDGKTISIKENLKEKEAPQNLAELPDNNSQQEKLSYGELEKALFELTKNFKTLQEQYSNIMQQNMELKNEIAMIKQEHFSKDAESKEVSEQGRSDSQSVSEPGRTDNTGLVFNRENAYIVNTVVPKFGLEKEDGSGLHEPIEGARFTRLEIDDIDESKNSVILTVTEENGKNREIKLPQRTYNEYINAQKNLLERLENIDKENSPYEWMVAHMKYREDMELDDFTYKLNTAKNFMHNFRLHCIREAKNPNDAMKIAAAMFDDMPPNEKAKFNTERRLRGKEFFDKDLLDAFYDTAKFRKLSKEDLSFDKKTTGIFIDEKNQDFIKLKFGDTIPGTETKVGDTISMAIKTSTFDGKLIEGEKCEYKIVAVSKNLKNENRAKIFDEKTQTCWDMPLKDFVSYIHKYEKEQVREYKEKIKKDNKHHRYEGRSY